MDISSRKTTFTDSSNQKNIQGSWNHPHSEGVSYFSHSCLHHPSLIYQLNQLMDLIGLAVLRITSLWAAGAASSIHYVCPLYCTCLTRAASSLCHAETSQHSFIFKPETKSKDAPQVEVKLHNYRLGCCRLAETLTSAINRCVWWEFGMSRIHITSSPWPASLLWALFCHFLSLPLKALRGVWVSAAWCYVPSVHLSLRYA